jgi:DNA-binding NarL/FixJ family response regulator
MMKVLVIDDHVLIRQAMRGVLKKVTRDAVTLEAPNSIEAMRILATNPGIDFILLDLTLPDRDGFSVFSELRERYPAIGIVILSAAQDAVRVRKALELGARGFIPKSATGDVILNALRLILSGGIYVPPEILSSGNLSAQQSRHSLASASLSDRHLEVLALLMQGKSNKTIGRMLDIAEPTVKNHVTAILRALNVTSRTEAVIEANKLGWEPAEVRKR